MNLSRIHNVSSDIVSHMMGFLSLGDLAFACCACKYWNMNGNRIERVLTVHSDCTKSPLRSSLDHHGIPRDRQRLFFALCGRFLPRLRFRAMEKHSCLAVPFILGPRGTGKSAFIRAITDLFDYCRVQYLGSEEGASLTVQYGNQIIVGQDLEHDSWSRQMSLAGVYNLMLCLFGRETPFMPWVLLSGQAIPKVLSQDSKFKRRMFVVEFENTEVDPLFSEKCQSRKQATLNMLRASYNWLKMKMQDDTWNFWEHV